MEPRLPRAISDVQKIRTSQCVCVGGEVTILPSLSPWFSSQPSVQSTMLNAAYLSYYRPGTKRNVLGKEVTGVTALPTGSLTISG